jgi:hypothetical protein
MQQILAYFKPLFPAVTYSCNLCGGKIGTDQYQTAKARRVEAAEVEGHYVFCLQWSPHISEIVNKICAEEARLAAAQEQERNGALARLASELISDLTGVSVVPPPQRTAADAPSAPVQRRRPPTQIPRPE